jgi:hypothetical protein
VKKSLLELQKEAFRILENQRARCLRKKKLNGKPKERGKKFTRLTKKKCKKKKNETELNKSRDVRILADTQTQVKFFDPYRTQKKTYGIFLFSK